MNNLLNISIFICISLIPLIAQDFWQQTNGPRSEGLINDIIINSNGHIFAGTYTWIYNTGLYRSSDNGDNWTQIEGNLMNNSVLSLTTDREGNMFAGTYKGVFYSVDNGDNWIQSGLKDFRVYSLVIDSSGTVYAGTDNHGLYSTTDKGNNWTQLDSNYFISGGFSYIDLNTLSINPSGHLFAGTGILKDSFDCLYHAGGAIYRSDDNGNHWIQTSLPNLWVSSIYINSEGHVFAATDSGVYRSVDNGDNWILTGLAGEEIVSFASNPAGDIFAGTENGHIYYSTDNGVHWTDTSIDCKYIGIRCIAINSSGHIFAGTGGYGCDGSSGNGIYHSIDGGVTWIHEGFMYGEVRDIVSVNPGGEIYIVQGRSGVWQSADNGDNWTEYYVNGMVNYFNAIAVNFSGHIFVGGGDGIYRSIDNGNHWTQVGLKDLTVTSLEIDSSGTIFAAADGRIHHSIDNGDHWTQSVMDFHSVNTIAINPSGYIFAGTYKGVFYSVDNGEHWNQLPSLGTYVYAQSFAFNSSGHIYAGTEFNGIYRSLDSGAHWTKTSLPDSRIESLLITPQGHVYAGASGNNSGVYCSKDNGETWSRAGLEDINVFTLSINSYGYIFAGTSNGVFQSVQPTFVNENNNELPSSYKIYQNFPNPFNPSTTIEFSLPKSEFVELKVYNILGKEVSTLITKKLNQGSHTYTFDGSKLASGIYYYQLVAGEYREVKKMILLK